MAASPILWSPSVRGTNPVTLMTTELNSLANNTGIISSVAASGVAENATSLDLFADFELLVTFGVAPTAGSPVELYFVRSVDGTNYDDTSAAPVNGFGDVWPVRASTSAQRLVIPQIEIPPLGFKLYVRNGAGQTFAASGNTVRAYFYRRAVG